MKNLRSKPNYKHGSIKWPQGVNCISPKVLYRAEFEFIKSPTIIDNWAFGGYFVYVDFLDYTILEETECGYWIDVTYTGLSFGKEIPGINCVGQPCVKKAKFVLKKPWRKAFAYTCPNRALESLYQRRKKYIEYLKANLEKQIIGIEIIKDYKQKKKGKKDELKSTLSAN